MMFHFQGVRKFLFSTVLLFAAFIQSAFAAPSLPNGFKISLVAGQISRPTHISFAPDGRIFVSEKSGKLRVIKNGQLLTTPFLTVNTDDNGEHGLIGVAFDPDFARNSYVYIYYIAKTPFVHSRVSRFTANGDKAVPGSEKIILEGDDIKKYRFHVSGGLQFGSDGKLYISIGDNAGAPYKDNSQRLNNLWGKILRINSDGTIPSDNPFYSHTTGKYRAIWAYGLRNPFSFSFQPGTSRIFINDVGALTWEEINEGFAGHNYGWPATEGPTTNAKFTTPIFAYLHGPRGDDSVGCGISGGTFYNPTKQQYPNEYVGQYFFIDYCNNWMHVMNPDTGKVKSFAKAFSSNPVGVVTGPDGSLYYGSQWLNGVYKISYSSN